MISLTGLAWLWVALIMGLFATRQFREARRHDDPLRSSLATSFAWFFAFLFIMSALFTVSLWSLNPSLIKSCLLIGHAVLWIAFAIIADVLWQTALYRRVSRWLFIILVLGLGGIELFLESMNHRLPALVAVGTHWAIVDWNMNLVALLLLVFIVWALALPMGVYFINEAHRLSRSRGKYKGLGMGVGFIITAVASALSPLHQSLLLLELETLFLALGPTVLLLGVVTSARESSDTNKEPI